MVGTITIATSFATFAGLLSLALSVPALPPRDVPTIAYSEYYHWKNTPPDPAKKVDEVMARERALSLAKFEGNHEAKYFWFLQKHIGFEGNGPEEGCRVALYFDNIFNRAKKAVELDWNYNATGKVEDKWAVAGGITPWCGKYPPSQNNEYKDDQLGFVYTRPSLKPELTLIVLLRDLRNPGQGEDDTVVANHIDLIWGHEGGQGPQTVNGVYPGFEAKFKAAVNATYNPIVNPYKYGKADQVWSKVKPDNFFGGK